MQRSANQDSGTGFQAFRVKNQMWESLQLVPEEQGNWGGWAGTARGQGGGDGGSSHVVENDWFPLEGSQRSQDQVLDTSEIICIGCCPLETLLQFCTEGPCFPENRDPQV